MNIMEQIRPKIAGLQKFGLIAGILGLLVCGAGVAMDPTELLRSWLFGFLFWFSIALGSLAFLMVHHTTGGGWGFIIRRPLEAGARTVPFMAIFFLPLLASIWMNNNAVYPWVTLHDEAMVTKRIWLNAPFYTVRFLIYFGVWTALALTLTRWSKRQDENGDKLLTHKAGILAPAGLVLYVVLLTWAGVDWVMSMNPHWYSSMFGGVMIAGQVLATISFMNILVAYLTRGTDLLKLAPRKYLGDLGNFNMAFTLLWAYINYGQWLIIYHGNISEEATWFLERSRNGWQYIAGTIIFIQFILPFATLAIGTNIKREPHRLWKVAALILFMRAVDLFWYVMPTHREHLKVTIFDIATLVGIGGIWLFLFARELNKNVNWVPLHDPRLYGEWPPHGALPHESDLGGNETFAGTSGTDFVQDKDGIGVVSHG